MKCIKAGKRVSVKLNLPKDAHWSVYRLLLIDLGFDEIEHKDIFSAIRHRNIPMLLEIINRNEPRRMLECGGYDSGRGYPDTFYRNYQAGAFLKKFPFKNKGKELKEAAFRSFRAAENICLRFNSENFKGLLSLDEHHPDFLGIIEEIRNDISSLLGKVPNVDCISGHAMHGPGVSVGDAYKDGRVTCYFKYSTLPYTVTRLTLPYARSIIEDDPRWVGALDNWYRTKSSISFFEPKNLEDFWAQIFQVVDGNRVTTVPKSVLTDRTIAIEPMLNVYLQLGVDRIIRRALKYKWHYDLNDQTHNQEMARVGSITNDLCTLDLKMASETVSLKLCELLLPADWYNLLYDLRSPMGSLEGESFTYEKISSMGNGYTFALESLVFGALARCAMRRTKTFGSQSAVYGDDLIVPKPAARYLIELLNICGFTVNEDKSFLDGPFRESCGADWFRGWFMRPVFLKRRLESLQDLFYLHNALIVAESKYPWFWDVSFPKTRQWILDRIPRELRNQFRGPVSESLDTHLFLDGPYFSNSNGRYYCKIVPTVRKFNKDTDYFFRKLMVQPGKSSRPLSKWESIYLNSSGNAFDVVKRDRVLYMSSRCPLL